MTPAIPDLEIWGVYDRGIPNRERIALKAHAAVALSEFALVFGVVGSNGNIVPLPDQFLWLGRTVTDAGWVLVYTGTGDQLVTKEQHTQEPLHTIYWGKPHVVFTSPMIHVALLRISQVDINGPDRNIEDYIKLKNEVAAAGRLSFKQFLELTEPPKAGNDGNALRALLRKDSDSKKE